MSFDPPPGAIPAGMPQPGELIAGQYLVEQVMGVGGMGVVLAAVQQPQGYRVAIKLLRPEAAATPDALARFVREAQAASSIRSEHVARVYDVGTLRSGLPYMVMEHLDGLDLGQLLARRPWLPTLEAVDYVMQACEAVAHAHHLGIVHRDLKPANLFLSHRADGTALIKVLDFGISKITTPGASVSLTATSLAFGTPMYMSPEQVRSTKHVDPRTDLWALGAILHELLTGETPFEGDSLPALSAAITADPPRPLRRARPDVPEALERVVLWCLQKPLAARPLAVIDLARALAPFGPAGSTQALLTAIEQAGASTVPLVTSPSGFDASGAHPAWVTSPTSAPSSRRWVALAAVATLAAGVLAVGAVKALLPASAPASETASGITSASASAAASAAPVAPAAATTSSPAAIASVPKASAQPASSAPPTVKAPAGKRSGGPSKHIEVQNDRH